MRDRLDDLVLARLVGARGSARRVDQLATATKRFAPGSFDHSAWRELVEAARQRLAGAGAIDATGAPAGTAAEVWARLGSRTAVPWQRLVERVIPGLALGIAATDTRAHARLSDRDAWAAAIFGRSTGLWPEGLPPTLAQVCDACVWSRLGLAGVPKRTPPEVRAHFVARWMTADAGAGAAPDRLVRLHAAAAVGAPRADLRALRDALGRRWITGATWTTNGARPAAPPAPDARLAALADAVRDAAGAETRSVFGDRKVFIAAVWRALRGRPPVGDLDLDGFKRELIAAHRAGLISLARADLVGVMDPAEVAASETTSAEARYHFVVREVAREN